MKLVYFGSGAYGLPPLRRLVTAHDVALVVTQPDRPAGRQRRITPTPIGRHADEAPELYHLGSPINHVGPHCPPTLLLQGAHDSGAMAPDVRRLHRALRQAGVPSVYVEFPDTEHGFDLFAPRWSPAAQAATYDTSHFLALMAQA